QQATIMAREYARNALKEIHSSKDAFRKLISGGTPIEPFDAMNPPKSQLGGIISFLAERTAEGNVSEVSDTPDGAVFVFVRKRTLPDAGEFVSKKIFMASLYEKMKRNSANLNFQRWLQSQCRQYPQQER
ncbi:MAG: hypothetical protein PHQ27_06795, partial [Victivallales bacterium]|nr:hypothetical protein [Victivallales bacterium]